MEKSNLSGSKIIAIILLIILLLGLGFFAVVDGIRERTSEIFHSVVSLLDNSADILRRARNLIFFWQYTAPGDGENGVFVYLIDNEDINGIAEERTGVRTGLINQSVEMDTIGLDSTIIKEMDVVFNASKGTTSTLVLAELGLVYKYDADGNKILGNPDNDVLDAEDYILADDEILKVTDPEQYIEKFKLQDTERANQILKKYSSNNMEIEDKKIGERIYQLHYFIDATGVKSKLFWFQADNQFGEEHNGKYYLGAFGVIHIQDSLGNDMIYRDQHNLELLIQDYQTSQGKTREEAVKTAIEKSYGMTDIGTIYVYNWDSLKEHTKYQFKDEDAIKSEPEITLLDEITTQTIELEDLLNYSKFTIPVELTTDLLNITGSDEFADVFLHYALRKTEIFIRLYKQENIKTTYLAKQYDIDPKQFFLEIYNFDDENTFNEYKDIVVNRTYNGASIEIGGIKAIADQEMAEAGAENNNINSAIATTRNYLNGIESSIVYILNSTYSDYGNLITLIVTEQDNGNIGGYDIHSVLNSIGWYQQHIRNLDIDGNVENCESAIQALEYLKSYVEGLRGEIYKLYDLAERLRAYEYSQNADSGLQNWIANNRDNIQAIRSSLYNYSRDGGIIDQYIERKQAAYEDWRFGKDLEDALLLENQGNDGNGTNLYTVTETKVDRAVSENFVPFVKEVNTWYATMTYYDPEQEIQYTIKKGQTDVVEETEYEEYDALIQYICEENRIDESELNDRGIDFTPETIERKEGYGISGITNNKLWYRRYEDIDATKKENYENFTIKNLAEEVAVTGEAYNSDYNKSSTKSDYIYAKFDKNNKRAYDGERTRTEHYEMGTVVAQTAEERDARIKEFLGLLKNTEGTIAGSADGYNPTGKVVEYYDIYFSKAKVGNLLENGAEMLFQLLESSESTAGLADVFRYIMYLYTGIDYGVTSLDFVLTNASFSGRAPIYSIGINVKTDDPNTSLPVLTEAQIRDVIERNFSGEARDNLIEALPGLVQGQNIYKVNAIFSIAVAQQESQCGTDWEAIDSSTYNMYSIKGSGGWNRYNDFSDAALSFARLISGSNYFGAGRVTVTAIQPVYCPRPPGWAEAVTEHIRRMCETCGLEITEVLGGSVENANEMVEAALGDLGKTGSQMSSKLGYSGEWCAEFATYYYEQFGFIPSVLDKRYSRCTLLMEYAKSKDIFFKEASGYVPQTGDLVLYNWKANRNSDADHVGIVVSNNGSTITTVEGNIGDYDSWSSRRVGTREREVWWSCIVGYVSLSVALGR